MNAAAESLTRAVTSRWILAAAVLLAFFWQLGAVPLYDLDEGAFTEATREMLSSGTYITPHKDGEPRYDKPVTEDNGIRADSSIEQLAKLRPVFDKAYGTLSAGKTADLLVVDGDPSQDVSILQQSATIELVMKSGRVVVDRR